LDIVTHKTLSTVFTQARLTPTALCSYNIQQLCRNLIASGIQLFIQHWSLRNLC